MPGRGAPEGRAGPEASGEGWGVASRETPCWRFQAHGQGEVTRGAGPALLSWSQGSSRLCPRESKSGGVKTVFPDKRPGSQGWGCGRSERELSGGCVGTWGSAGGSAVSGGSYWCGQTHALSGGIQGRPSWAGLGAGPALPCGAVSGQPSRGTDRSHGASRGQTTDRGSRGLAQTSREGRQTYLLVGSDHCAHP